jgi:drug/metabolite transporter (DMT)-like permease
MKRKSLIADLLLFSVAVFWGFNFVVIKDATERITDVVSPLAQSVLAGTMVYVLFRYLVATLIFSAARPRALTHATRAQWGMGGLLGVFYLTALVVQTVALQYTTPGKSGFITGLSVAMVPFLYWAVARRSPGWFQILGAVVATVGLGVLSLRGDLTLSWGDGLTLLGALLYGLHIMTTGFFAPKVPPSTLAVTQMAASTALCLAVTPFLAHITFDLPWQAWAAIVWTAVTGTIYAFFIQSWAQRYTTATHAAVLLCFESVFAAISGVIFGMDSVTWRLLTGASLIFTGTLIIELLPQKQGRGTDGDGGSAGALLQHEAAAGALLPVDGAGGGADAPSPAPPRA